MYYKTFPSFCSCYISYLAENLNASSYKRQVFLIVNSFWMVRHSVCNVTTKHFEEFLDEVPRENVMWFIDPSVQRVSFTKSLLFMHPKTTSKS